MLQLSIFILLFGAASGAHAQAVSFHSKATKSKVNLPAKEKWSWKVNSEKVRVYQMNVMLAPSSTLSFVRAQNIESKSSKGRVLLGMNRLSEDLVFHQNGRETVITASLNVGSKPRVAIHGCNENDLRLRAPSLPVQFFLGVSCRSSAGKVVVDISAPGEFDWGATSLIESKGKGETWRSFDLGNIQAANGSVLNFTLLREGKEYSFSLVSQKKQGAQQAPPPAAPKPENPPIFGGGIGYYNLSAQTATGTFSGSSLGFFLEAWSAPVWKSLRVGGDYQYAPSTKEDSTGLDFNQFHLTGSWLSKLGSSFVLDSRLFIANISSSQGASNVNLKHSNFGLGVVGIYKSEVGSFEAGLSMSHFGSKSVTSSMDLGLGYKRKKETGLGWMLGLNMQNIEASTLSGRKVKFGQTFLNAGVLF